MINGVLFALGDSLSSAGLVLALLVRQLGGSLALLGLLAALQLGEADAPAAPRVWSLKRRRAA